MIMYRVDTYKLTIKAFEVLKIEGFTVYFKRRDDDVIYRSSEESEMYQWYPTFELAQTVVKACIASKMDQTQELFKTLDELYSTFETMKESDLDLE